jgi:hypothetical protein
MRALPFLPLPEAVECGAGLKLGVRCCPVPRCGSLLQGQHAFLSLQKEPMPEAVLRLLCQQHVLQRLRLRGLQER